LNKLDSERPGDLHPLVWVGLPAASLALCFLAPLMGYKTWEAFMTQERGFVEQATVVFLVPAIILAGGLFIRHRRRLPKWVGLWMLLIGIGAFYFAGEESNWGQNWFGWKTPDEFAERIRPGEIKETAFHHIVGLEHLESTPRMFMTPLLGIGAVILPLVMRKRFRRPGAPRSPWYWIVPTPAMVPAAALAVLSTVPKKIMLDVMNIPREELADYPRLAFVEQAGEFKEYYVAMAILFYVLSVWLRLRSLGDARAVAEMSEQVG